MFLRKNLALVALGILAGATTTVERMSQLLETAYKGRYPEDAGLEGLKKILADKGARAGA